MKLPSDTSRYFIAIIPPSPIRDEAFVLKNYFKEKYNSKASLNSPPHITLYMPFQWKSKEEEELLDALNDFSKGKEQFNIEFEGFGVFAPRVIFISVKLNELLNQFQQQLQHFCKNELKLLDARYKDQPFHPHLTLAFRDLKKEMFAAAWSEFKGKSFSESFPASGFTLLKHDGMLWQPYSDFAFKS